MKEWLLENFISILTTVFGGGSFFAYVIERRKRKIEEKQLNTDALKSMQDAYDRFTEDSLDRYNSVRGEINELKKQLGNVTFQLAKEKDKYLALKLEHEALRSAYELLKSEFELYKTKYNN